MREQAEGSPNILSLVIAATNARLERIETALGITGKTPAEEELDAAIDAFDAEEGAQ